MENIGETTKTDQQDMSDQLARVLLGFAQCRWENFILNKK
jgi:hypothetical protein